MDVISKIISFLMVVVLLFLLPLDYLLGQRQGIANGNIENETARFVDSIRSQGYFDVEMYEEYLYELSITGEPYDIELEHAVLKEGDRFGASKELPGVMVATAELQQLPASKSEEDEIVSFATHTHNSDCYGHVHNTSCYAHTGKANGNYGLTVSKSSGSWGITGYQSTRFTFSCSSCGSSMLYLEYYDNFYRSDYIGEMQPDSVRIYGNYYNTSGTKILIDTSYTDTHPSYSGILNRFLAFSTFLTNKHGIPAGDCNSNYYGEVKSLFGNNIPVIGTFPGCTNCVSVPIRSLVCGKTDAPLCNQIVTSLSATAPYQKINRGESIDSTAIATYLDGHTATVSCTNNISPNILGNQTVTLTYSGLVDNASTVGIKTCQALVHTHSKDCYAGHNHVADDCVDGYICHDGALTMDTEGTYYNETRYNFRCATCGKEIIRFEIQYFDTNDNYFIYTMRWSSYHNDYVLTQSNYYIDSDYENQDVGNQSVYGLFGKVHSLPKNAKALYKNYPEFNFTAVYSWDTNWVTNWRPPTCSLPNDPNPICDWVVTSITATNPVQNVDMGSSIITTATATYLDGHTDIVDCSSNYNSNVGGKQIVILSYSGLVDNAGTTGTKTCVITVTVRGSKPEALLVSPSTYIVYNGSEPTYTVTVRYVGGSTKLITTGYSKTGWTSGPGTKTVTFVYTENGATVSSNVAILVKPNLVGITVMPTSLTVERYTNPVLTVNASYEDGSTYAVAGASITGYDSNRIGPQEITVSYTENHITRYAKTLVTVIPMIRLCPVCGREYYLDDEDFDRGCPSCKTIVSYIQASPEQITLKQHGFLDIIVTATFLDGHTETVMGWSSNFDPGRTGLQLVMVTFQGKFTYISVMVAAAYTCSSCGAAYGLTEDGSDSGCPFCREALVSISATPSYQSVNQGGDISLTVRGSFRDGHTEELQGWYSSYDKNLSGEQLVTVYYGELSCMVTVEVISELTVSCEVCQTAYNLREHPWGCPVCSDTLAGIEASLQNGGTLVPYGEELDLRVVLTYRDGHRVLAFNGWTEDFDPYTMGRQSVTISMKDRFHNTVSCMLEVVVTDQLVKKVCDNGHVYYTEDPLAECPYCASGSMIRTEQYYSISFTEEILDKLYTDGIYRLNPGDYISVKVTMRTQGSTFSLSLFHGRKVTVPVTYGGEVA